MYGLPKSMCVVFVIQVCVQIFPPYIRFVCLYELNSEIDRSYASCARMLFMCFILCLMCSGSSLHVECIPPFGMLRLSAWKMMFVEMVFSVRISVGG